MANPRERRLLSDFEKVKNLVSESGGTLKLIKTTGNPPTSYTVEYHCPGIDINSSDQVFLRNLHQAEFNLGLNYPFEKPTARMLTPIFNPHVFSSGAICLGSVWSPTETLDNLILRIGALIQLDPKVLDEKSPANVTANLWVQKNRQKLPLGTIGFKVAKTPPNRIQWF
jgi:ubiquitin-protein ligase